MKRILLIVLGVVVVLFGGWWGYATFGASSQVETTQSDIAQEGNGEELDDLANVIWASGKLEPVTWAGLGLINGGIVSQIHVAEGDWVEAGQLLLELNDEISRSQVAEAEAAVAEAEAARDKLLAGATTTQIAATEAELAAAKANVDLARGQLTEAQAAIAAAEEHVHIAQREYNEMIQAHTTLAGQDTSSQQLVMLRGTIDTAQVEVDMAQSRIPSTEAQVQSALAYEESAQAMLDNLLAGATAEEIGMAEARVQLAQATLASAQAQLRQNQLTAPFDGQVGAVNVRLGELVNPGQFLILLGDTRQMHVKTTDLRETDVVRLQSNMPVEVTFDALPEQVFQGKITQIAPMSTTDKGSTNYTVQIDVDSLDESLRWGMTAFVNIQAPPQ